MITIKTPVGELGFNASRFPGGERHLQLDEKINNHFVYTDNCSIVAHLEKSDEIMLLLLVTDALRRKYGGRLNIDLVMPYVPYARQDRVCVPGEALSARVFCDLINAQKYSTVTIWDAHSEVVPALLDRCINVHCSEFVRQFAKPDWILVAPDGTAAKEKVPTCAKRVGCQMITATKHRDLKTGKLTGTSIIPSEVWTPALENGFPPTFLMVDDICDGGATFVALAKEITKVIPRAKIKLYVTHGIFSQGLSVFGGLINEVITPNPFEPWKTYGSEERYRQQGVKFTHLNKELVL